MVTLLFGGLPCVSLAKKSHTSSVFFPNSKDLELLCMWCTASAVASTCHLLCCKSNCTLLFIIAVKSGRIQINFQACANSKVRSVCSRRSLHKALPIPNLMKQKKSWNLWFLPVTLQTATLLQACLTNDNSLFWKLMLLLLTMSTVALLWTMVCPSPCTPRHWSKKCNKSTLDFPPQKHLRLTLFSKDHWTSNWQGQKGSNNWTMSQSSADTIKTLSHRSDGASHRTTKTESWCCHLNDCFENNLRWNPKCALQFSKDDKWFSTAICASSDANHH